jgi:hypothetical protein
MRSAGIILIYIFWSETNEIEARLARTHLFQARLRRRIRAKEE